MITKLNKEQKSNLSVIKDKWLNKIFNYELYNSITNESVSRQMKELYKFCGLKEPKVILVGSPLACQIAVNLFLDRNEVGKKIEKEAEKKVENEVWNKVRNEVGNEVGKEIWNEIWNEVEKEIRIDVGNEVRNEVEKEIWNEVRDKVGTEVENEVEIKVRNEVWNDVWIEVENEVWNEVKNKVGNKVLNKVVNEVWKEVDNEVWNEVGKGVRDEVENEVRDEVQNEVEIKVRNVAWNEVWNGVDKDVEKEIRNKVGNEVGKEVENEVGNKVGKEFGNKKLKYCNFSSYINYSDFGWLSLYEYLLWNTNILDKYKDKLNFIIDCVNNSFMSIQLNGLCIVSKYPIFISRNSNKQLHNINGYAIKFEDGYGQYYFNGININPNLFNKLISKSYTFEEWTNESNEEIKSLVLAFYEEKFGGEFVFRFISKYLKEINTYVDKKSEEYLKNTVNSMNIGVYTLFKGSINDTVIAYVRCYCPSTDRMFFLGVNPSYNNAKDAIASLCQIPRILKDNLISINRQGEIFSFNFDKEGTKLLKDNLISKEDLNDVISLTGDEYFSKIKFEY